jgi:hypothetical protein
MSADRIEITRQIAVPPAKIFALPCRPSGHVAIDAGGMPQSAGGEPITAVGDLNKRFLKAKKVVTSPTCQLP